VRRGPGVAWRLAGVGLLGLVLAALIVAPSLNLPLLAAPPADGAGPTLDQVNAVALQGGASARLATHVVQALAVGVVLWLCFKWARRILRER
jgi:hypothetical protein